MVWLPTKKVLSHFTLSHTVGLSKRVVEKRLNLNGWGRLLIISVNIMTLFCNSIWLMQEVMEF